MSYEIGTRVGDYQVVEVLGSGGMGQVYKVRNLISDRIEAMKVLLPNLDTDHELADRFMREIKVQASLDHPNIAALHTAQRIDNQLVMIMEFVEGYTIESLMRRGRIPLPHVVDFAMQVLEALSYAHARGVIHRDIKPANMMLTPKGVIKLMDFGIAKINDHRLTQTGKTVGSLFYMSPEQIRGDSQVDARSDVYSLGISLYEMATGRRPFEGDSDYSIMAAHLQQQPPPPLQIDPALPQLLSDIILMSLAKDPARRFQTADAFRLALRNAVSQLGAGAGIGAGAAAALPQPVAHTAPMLVPPMPTQQPIFSPPQPSPTHPSQQQMRSAPLPPPQPAAPPQYQGAPQQQFRPMPPPQAQASKSHRGVYMLLGSLVTVGIIVAAAIYLPKLWKTGASDKPSTTQVAQVKPVPQQPVSSAQTPPAPASQQPPASETPASQPPAAQPQDPPQPSSPTRPVVTAPPPAKGQPKNPPGKSPATPPQPSRPSNTPTPENAPPVTQPSAQMPQPTAPRPQQPSTPPPPSDPVPTRQVPPTPPTSSPNAPPIPQPRKPGSERPNPVNGELDELTRQKNLMMPRIQAVNESMKNLREQNQRNGLGVSAELVASQTRMGSFMEFAAGALRAGNFAEARTSLANAERELEKLERRFNH